MNVIQSHFLVLKLIDNCLFYPYDVILTAKMVKTKKESHDTTKSAVWLATFYFTQVISLDECKL